MRRVLMLLTLLMSQAGPRSLTLTTPSGTVTAPNVFTVSAAPPAITQLTPSSGAPGQTVSAILSGSNLATVTSFSMPGATVTPGQLAFGQVPLSIMLPANIAPGPKTLTITGPGGAATADFTVTFPAPTFASITPSSLVQGSVAVPATIIGTNLLGVTSVGLGQGVTVVIQEQGRTNTTLPVIITVDGPVAYAPCLDNPLYRLKGQNHQAGCDSPFLFLAMGEGASQPLALADAKFKTAVRLKAPWEIGK